MKKLLLLIFCLLSLIIQAQESKFSAEKLLSAPVAGSFRMEGYWGRGATVVEAESKFHPSSIFVTMGDSVFNDKNARNIIIPIMNK